jgi:Ca-activated chloride channel homolog
MKTAKHITHLTPVLALSLAIAACSQPSGQGNTGLVDNEARKPAPSSQQPGDENYPRERADSSYPVAEQELSAIAVSPPGVPATAKIAYKRQEAAYATADVDLAGASARAVNTSWHATAVDRENYLHYQHNGVKLVSEHPVSTFSVDVDTASYANVRRMLVREGRMPPSDAVRLEEMINYFNYSYPQPQSSEQPFRISTELAPAPWSERAQLLQIGLKGYEPRAEQRPAANLVFLVDVSGSMQSADKLGLVKKSLRLLVNRMDARDSIALAVYAGAAGTVLESTPASEKAKILAAIDALQAGGSTHGSAGIKLAYGLASQHFIEGGINRVIIASDGDMNVGTVNLEALKDLVEQKRKDGIALTTLGFGSGNYNYALMEQLADVGNGNAAYIDSLQEAQKVLVNEMQSTLLTIAADVKIQVEFNPAAVSEYRLIGYENRMLNREDFTNDKIDAGDIGAGHTVTALYEIVLSGAGGERIPALRYGSQASAETRHDSANELAFVKLRYKQPGQARSVEHSQAISRDAIAPSIAGSSDNLRFAASVAGFGELLRGGIFTGQWNYDDALALARNARGTDPHGYRGEFVHLIELAQSLSSGS